MHLRMLLLTSATTLLLAGAAPGLGSARPDNAALVEQVRAAELAFARSMADRDFAAFGRFVAEDTVFFSGRETLAGRAAVLEAWKGYFQPGPAPFAWEPDQVVVLRSGDLAMTSGPVTGPDGKVVARFNSIWRRQRSGRWQVVFDKGSPVCAPATAPAPAAG